MRVPAESCSSYAAAWWLRAVTRELQLQRSLDGSVAVTDVDHVDCVGGPHLYTLAARRHADQLAMELR
jgi:hypothetical protein